MLVIIFGINLCYNTFNFNYKKVEVIKYKKQSLKK